VLPGHVSITQGAPESNKEMETLGLVLPHATQLSLDPLNLSNPNTGIIQEKYEKN
jgi:hypothetical protein